MTRNKEEQARLEGMAQALRIVKSKGIEGLEADLKMRNITGLPCRVPRSALDEVVTRIKNNMVDTFMIMTAYTLHCKFGYGQKRLERFIEEFLFQTDCLSEDYIAWEDQIEVLRKECGIKLEIRRNDSDVRID